MNIFVSRRRPATLVPTTALVFAAVAACGGGRDSVWNKPEVPIGTVNGMQLGDGGVVALNTVDPCKIQDAQEAEVEQKLSSGACFTGAPLETSLSGRFGVSMVPASNATAPGDGIDFAITLENLTDTELPIYFRLSPGAKPTFATFDSHNKQVDKPTGKAPVLPPVPPQVSHLVFAPHAKAHLSARWEATGRKWMNDAGVDRVVAGADLKKGEYTVRVFLPLIGILEGDAHELTTAKFPISVLP